MSADIQRSPTRGEGFPGHPHPASPSPGVPLHPWVPVGVTCAGATFHKRQQVRAGGQVRVGAAELLRVRLPRCEQSPPPGSSSCACNTHGGGLIRLTGRQRIIPGCGGHGQPSGEPCECDVPSPNSCSSASAACLPPAWGPSTSFACVRSAGQSWSRLGSVLLPPEPRSALPSCPIHSCALPGTRGQRERALPLW